MKISIHKEIYALYISKVESVTYYVTLLNNKRDSHVYVSFICDYCSVKKEVLVLPIKTRLLNQQFYYGYISTSSYKIHVNDILSDGYVYIDNIENIWKDQIKISLCEIKVDIILRKV